MPFKTAGLGTLSPHPVRHSLFALQNKQIPWFEHINILRFAFQQLIHNNDHLKMKKKLLNINKTSGEPAEPQRWIYWNWMMIIMISGFFSTISVFFCVQNRKKNQERTKSHRRHRWILERWVNKSRLKLFHYRRRLHEWKCPFVAQRYRCCFTRFNRFSCN